MYVNRHILYLGHCLFATKGHAMQYGLDNQGDVASSTQAQYVADVYQALLDIYKNKSAIESH